MTNLKSKWVTTKIPHKCFGCCRTFPAGVQMNYQAVADKGTVYSYYLCKSCIEVIKQYNTFHVTLREGELLPSVKAYEESLCCTA